MHLPYTDRYPEALLLASEALASSLTAVLWSRPLSKRGATALFAAAIWGSALTPAVPELARSLDRTLYVDIFYWLQACLTLATVATFWSGPRAHALLAALGQLGLGTVGAWTSESNDELSVANLVLCAALLGLHAVRPAPRRSPEPEERARYRLQDFVIFTLTVALACFVMTRIFDGVVFNGDEVANTFQADVYAHFRAYARPRACPSSFQNYWVFNYQGRVFSQYTPGWPLFMAPFQRLGVIQLAGPFAAGLLAVAVARLSRRTVAGFGATPADAARIESVAGPLGAGLMMLGPSVLLNGASRFSHTLVAASFAWAIESVAVVASARLSRRRAFGYGVVLGLATSLGLATRPADGGTLGVGVFLYFVWALWRRRVSMPAFLGTCLGFAALGGLTLVILRLQVGSWFHTGYFVTPRFHPEGRLEFAAPSRNELKYGLPLAMGSYMWWPVAPALGVGGLIRCLGGRERRVAFMLAVGGACLVAFYSSITFGRGLDDGLGPRYVMPTVVAQAAGTAALLAPLVARLGQALGQRRLRPRFRVRLAGPGLLALAAALVGAYLIVPLTYPVAYAEEHATTAPLRAARGLKNALVLIEQPHILTHVTNLAQNAPMDRNPSVLFAIRTSRADEACLARHYPGRTWYRTGPTDKLTPIGNKSPATPGTRAPAEPDGPHP